MSIDIVRAWKDPEYRKTLTAEQLAALPANPVEPIPVSDEELNAVVGGRGPIGTGTEYPDCCYNSTIGPKGTMYPDCCYNSTIGPKIY